MILCIFMPLVCLCLYERSAVLDGFGYCVNRYLLGLLDHVDGEFLILLVAFLERFLEDFLQGFF